MSGLDPFTACARAADVLARGDAGPLLEEALRAVDVSIATRARSTGLGIPAPERLAARRSHASARRALAAVEAWDAEEARLEAERNRAQGERELAALQDTSAERWRSVAQSSRG
jgi:hypothetical protein